METVEPFHDDGDEAALKSKELVLRLIECAESPFSRFEFRPGHITGTAVVVSPRKDRVLLVHHRRLNRWLLPGGHVENADMDVWDTARRETIEETGADLVAEQRPLLVGIDVHGIPANPRKSEPYHLHHDLVFRLFAKSDRLLPCPEVRDVAWCPISQFETYRLPVSIRRSVLRALWGW